MESTQAPLHRKTRNSQKIPLPKVSSHLHNLLEWYSHPTRQNIKNLHLHYTRDLFFKDPFSEIYTADDLQKYYEHTFSKITHIRFLFENILEKDRQAFVTWTMTAHFMGREFQIRGSSHFKFDSFGLCEYHRDYFDLSEEIYEHLPLIGYVFRGLKRVLN